MIVPFKAPNGTQLYAVRKQKLYYSWCYMHRDVAEAVDKKLEAPVTDLDRAANWRKTLGETVASDRTLTTPRT